MADDAVIPNESYVLLDAPDSSFNIWTSQIQGWVSEGTTVTFTYGFPSIAPAFVTDATFTPQGWAPVDTWSSITTNTLEESVVLQIFQVYESVVGNISFVPATDPNAGNLLFFNAGNTNDAIAGADSNNLNPQTGVAVINTIYTTFSELSPGSTGYQDIMHEVGHQMGLSETYFLSVLDDNNPLTDGFSKFGILGTDYPYLDTEKYTVMSYDWQDTGFDQTARPYSLQLLDIAALQNHFQSRNYSTESGDNTYYLFPDLGREGASVTAETPFQYTIWDGGGTNELNASKYDGSGFSVELDLRQGHFSSVGVYSGTYPDGTSIPVDFDAQATSDDPDPGNVAIALYTIIENATGTEYSDTLIGNSWNNKLDGGGGNDVIYGDGVVYDGDHGFQDQNTLRSSDGKVYSWGINGVAPNANNSGDDTLIGGQGADTAYGGYGNDTFIASGHDDPSHPGFQDHLEGDYYNGGGWIGGGTAANQTTANLIPYDKDGSDTVDYSNVHFTDTNGIEVVLNSESIGFAQKWNLLQGAINDGPEDALVSIENATLTSNDDLLVLGYAPATGVHGVFDGGDGIDTVSLTSSMAGDFILNNSNDSIYNIYGTGSDKFENFENQYLNGSAWTIPDLNKQGSTGGDFSESTLAGTFELDFTASGSLATASIGGNTFNISGGAGEFFADGAPDSSSNLTADLTLPNQFDTLMLGEFTGAYDIVLGTGGANIVFQHFDDDPTATLLDGSTTNILPEAPSIMYRGGDVSISSTVTEDGEVSAGDGSYIHDPLVNAESLSSITMGDGITPDEVHVSITNLRFPTDAFDPGHSHFDPIPVEFDLTVTVDGYGTISVTNDVETINSGSADALWDPYLDISFASGYTRTYDYYGVDTPDPVTQTETEYHGYWGNDVMTATATTLAVTMYGYGGDDTMVAAAGNDTLFGGDGNDTLDGGAGNNTLYGGQGADIFKIAAGSTAEIGDYNPGDGDSIVFADPNDLQAMGTQRNDNDLNLLIGAGKSIALDNFFTNAAEYTDTDGNSLWQATINGTNYVISDAGAIVGTADSSGSISVYDSNHPTWGDDVLTGTSGDDVISALGGNDTVSGLDGNDTLIGGTGNDTLIGGNGDDVYLFSNGDGQDVITDSQGSNTIKFDDSVQTTSVNYTQAGNDLVILYGSGNDQITVSGFFANPAEQVVFADGTVHSAADIAQQAQDTSVIIGTANNDVLAGVSTAGVHNVMFGLDGNDTIYAGPNGDTLNGGHGSDTIFGGAGNDLFIVGDNTFSDEGQFYGGGGQDTYEFVSNEFNGYWIVNGGTGESDSSTIILPTVGAAQQMSIGSYNSGGSVFGYVFTGTTGAEVDFIGTKTNLVFGNDDMTVSIDPTIANLTLVGGSGNDTWSGSGTGDNIFLGSGDNVLTETSGDNVIALGSGNDTINGGTGDDTYLASAGNGHAVINETGGNDQIHFDASVSPADVVYNQSGNDLTITYGSSEITVTDFFDTLTTAAQIEQVAFSDGTTNDIAYIESHLHGITVTGTSGNDGLTGTSGPDTIYGLGGNDTIDGGAGADTMIGGTGNDTYFVDNSNDIITENPGEGADTVVASVSYTLPNNVDNLVLTGTSTLTGTGNSGDNVLTANSGSDTLIGGAGSDTYVFHAGSGHDVVIDSGGTLDTISFDSSVSKSSVTFSETGNGDLLINYGSSGDNITVTGFLAGGDTIEQVQFSDGSVDNSSYINAHLTNVYTGTSGNDTLSGTGGPDYMYGLAGNDTYTVNDTGDIVVENPSAGTDTIDTSVNYTMPANVEVMYATVAGITITGGGGNDTLYGDHPPPGYLGATLYGGAGNDTLNDNGGPNYMAGGTGDDTYYVTANDTIVENPGEGIDTVITPYGFSLPANVENLTLTGTNYVNETGNASDNIITGNISNNTLDGGTGVDTLIGGGGNDTFIVDNPADIVTAGSGTDTIISSVSWDMSSAGHNNTDVENLFLQGGSASISGVGNSLNNTIESFGTGVDTLNGGAGADLLVDESTLTGGGDVFVVDNSGDTVQGQGGADMIQSSISFSLADSTHNVNQYVNNLTLTAANLTATANNNGDTLVGGYGGDTLNGGNGNDFLEVKSGVAIGGAGDDYLWNFSATSASTLEGGSGNDTFISRNAGDYLVGGAGNDVYYLAGPLTTAPVEASGGGTDTIHENDSFVSLSDSGYGNIENLYLDMYGLNGGLIGNSLANILSGDNYAQSLSGLAGSDTLYGNGGNDTLDGGTGADTMYGGTGDDTYYVDNTGDVVVEDAGVGTGTDTLIVSISGYTLPTNVENLGTNVANGVAILIGNDGNNVITGAGNSGETLIGGAGDDTLDPGGVNGGLHSLIGGLGNDTFIVDSVGHDVVIENANEGMDTVEIQDTSTNSGYTLPANVENLIVLSGSVTFNANGNSLNNILTGNGASNSLNGGAGDDKLDGGDGLDTLTGGTGADTFVFHGSTAFNNIDVVTDFKTTDNDKIDISDVITGYHSGLNIDNFVQLTTSGSNTLLKVDTDGSGTTYTQIATLNGVTGLNVDTLVANGELIV